MMSPVRKSLFFQASLSVAVALKVLTIRFSLCFRRCSKPFKKQESHEVQEYGNDCCHAQNKVLFTGFSEIAKSKRCRRTAIKLFVFFLCTSGFLYQTWTFLQMYLAYPITLQTSDEYPDSFTRPAITICNNNRFSRQLYCKNYPDYCTWEHTTWQSFCDSYRRMCPRFKPPDFNFGIPKFAAYVEADRRGLILNTSGPIIERSSIPLVDYHGFGLWSTYLLVGNYLNNGLLYTCFTLYSTILRPNQEIVNVSLADGYYLTIDLHPEDYFNTIDLVGASVVLHDPRKIVNPMTEGITLGAGRKHVLLPTMERTERLPPPYASNCKDYLTEWKKDGVGQLSKDDCIDACKVFENYNQHGCVAQTSSLMIPNFLTVCGHAYQEPSSEVHRKCSNTCQDACEENVYHVTADGAYDFIHKCNPTDEHCKNQYLYIEVSFNRMKMKKIKQIPRIESIELFSYIGGYLGMWLGISLSSVFDLAEMIYDVIKYAFLKLKRKKRRKPPTE